MSSSCSRTASITTPGATAGWSRPFLTSCNRSSTRRLSSRQGAPEQRTAEPARRITGTATRFSRSQQPRSEVDGCRQGQTARVSNLLDELKRTHLVESVVHPDPPAHPLVPAWKQPSRRSRRLSADDGAARRLPRVALRRAPPRPCPHRPRRARGRAATTDRMQQPLRSQAGRPRRRLASGPSSAGCRWQGSG